MYKTDGVVKITWIGDIMCEKPLQKSFNRYGEEVFYRLFKNTKSFFEESDFVVGNLETVFGGTQKPYTYEMYKFNTPDVFAKALSQSGVNFVTTATNHSLDQGIMGLERTLKILEQYQIEHTGTYRTVPESRIYIKEINGIRLGIVNYTYGTNTHETKIILSEEQRFHLNLVKPQTFNLQNWVGLKKVSPLRRKCSNIISKVLNEEQKMKIKRALGKTYNVPRIDELYEDELDEKYLDQFKKDIQEAKRNADIVVAAVHTGGQFNAEPGGFSEYIARLASENGADLFVGNHPHVVQKSEFQGKTFSAYSLGNYSISPSSVYILDNNAPEYSVALHTYVGSEGIMKITFSILKIVENSKHMLTVYPVHELVVNLDNQEREKIERDIVPIYNRFTNRNVSTIKIKREYEI